MRVTEYPDIHGSHRYYLRVEGLPLGGKLDQGEAVFLMRNPATAVGDEGRYHHTRNICCLRSQSWGYGTITEINLFGLRAKDKAQLFRAQGQGTNLVGDENDQVIYETVSNADLIVVGWGTTGGNKAFANKVQDVIRLIQPLGKQLYCFEKINGGSPKHPMTSKRVDNVKDLTPWP